MKNQCSRPSHRGSSPGNIFDAALRGAVQSSLTPLLPMMQPRLAEVFRRSELLDQPSEVIAFAFGIPVDAANSLLEDSRAEMQEFLMLSAAPSLNCTCQPHQTIRLRNFEQGVDNEPE